MALFFLLSIALLASTYHLIRTLKSSHADEMVREADVLMGLFITYALSYFLRALFFVGLGKYGKMWKNVFPTWSCSKIQLIDMLTYFVSFLLWDITPILYQIFVHHQNFKIRKEDYQVNRTDTLTTQPTCDDRTASLQTDTRTDTMTEFHKLIEENHSAIVAKHRSEALPETFVFEDLDNAKDGWLVCDAE